MKDLSEIRKEIDVIDGQIIDLYKKRMGLTTEVAEYKISTGKAVLDREREKNKLDTLTKMVDTEFSKNGVRELFEQIMSTSRKKQYQLLTEQGRAEDLGLTEIAGLEKEHARVVYQGVEGAYAHLALISYFGEQTEKFHVDTWRDAMEAIKHGQADYAVLPFENSSAGIVAENYDLLREYGYYIVGESIPQKNTKKKKKKVCDDKDPTQAAIASRLTSELYGLHILDEGIQNNSMNETRFIIVSRKNEYIAGAGKISICVQLKHESGALYHALSHFIFNGLNMTSIESRPIPGRNWEYQFFIDFDGNLKEAAVQNALRGLKEETLDLKIFGNY